MQYKIFNADVGGNVRVDLNDEHINDAKNKLLVAIDTLSDAHTEQNEQEKKNITQIARVLMIDALNDISAQYIIRYRTREPEDNN